MRLTLRVDGRNLCHTRITVFSNRQSCGTLTLTNDEFTELVNWLSLGKREHEFVVDGQNQVDWNWREWNADQELDEMT